MHWRVSGELRYLKLNVTWSDYVGYTHLDTTVLLFKSQENNVNF